MDRKSLSLFIKEEARKAGFIFCGIARARYLEEEAPLLEKWLKQNMNGEMHYMENHFDLRLDPRKLLDGAKSIISLGTNYFPEKDLFENKEFKVSKYAYGRDYHKVIKAKLKQLLVKIAEEVGNFNGRAFVDSAPILEKKWALESGNGWLGKNGNIINKQQGSFFFLSELIIDLELEYDVPYAKDFCGNCTRCIDACPTEAIVSPKVVDGSKCISYLTIELKKSIPEEYHDKMKGWIFGCDICQDVCPWNRFSRKHNENDFEPKSLFLQDEIEWRELTEETFDKYLKGSPIKRAGFGKLKTNLLS